MVRTGERWGYDAEHGMLLWRETAVGHRLDYSYKERTDATTGKTTYDLDKITGDNCEHDQIICGQYALFGSNYMINK